MARGLESDVAAAGLEDTAFGHRDVGQHVRLTVTEEVDAVVADDVAGDGDVAVRHACATEIDHGTRLARVDRHIADRIDVPLSEAREAEERSVHRTRLLQRDLEGTTQHEAAVENADLEIEEVRVEIDPGRVAGRTHIETVLDEDVEVGRVDRCLQIGAECADAVVVGHVGRSDGDESLDDAGSEIQADRERDVIADVTARELRISLGEQFFRPGRREDREIARGTEIDRGVLEPDAQARGAAEDDALVGEGLERAEIGVGRTGTALEVDQGTRVDLTRQADLAVRRDGDAGRTCPVFDRRTDEVAARIAHVDDLAAGHEETEQFCVLRSSDVDLAVVVDRRQASTTR